MVDRKPKIIENLDDMEVSMTFQKVLIGIFEVRKLKTGPQTMGKVLWVHQLNRSALNDVSDASNVHFQHGCRQSQ
jgi:hypothetical protein